MHSAQVMLSKKIEFAQASQIIEEMTSEDDSIKTSFIENFKNVKELILSKKYKLFFPIVI